MANHVICLKDFSKGVSVHSEEDVKQKIIMRYLKSLDYLEEEMRFENPITVQVGSRKVTLYSDIEIIIDGRPEIVIDVKSRIILLTIQTYCKQLLMQSLWIYSRRI